MTALTDQPLLHNAVFPAYSYEELSANIEAEIRKAEHVKINEAKLEYVAEQIRRNPSLGTSAENEFRIDPAVTLPRNDEDLIQYLLMATAQQFCIWAPNEETGLPQAWQVNVNGNTYTGGSAINACLIRAMREGRDLLDPECLISLTMDDVRDIFRPSDDGSGQPLFMLGQRKDKFNEVGQVLQDMYSGHAKNLLREADGYLYTDNSTGIIQRLTLDFPISYFDWPYCKLATLYVSLLQLRRSFNLEPTPEYDELTVLKDQHHLDVAPDYYIPLFLTRSGVLEISDRFRTILMSRSILGRNTQIEREMRAACMVVGRRLAESTGRFIAEMDQILWDMGFMHCRPCFVGASQDEVPCVFRDNCHSYQVDTEYMQSGWPLVFTPCY